MYLQQAIAYYITQVSQGRFLKYSDMRPDAVTRILFFLYI